MSTLTTRIYENEQHARDVANKLTGYGMSSDRVRLLTANNSSAIHEAISAGCVSSSNVAILASHLESGRTVLGVNAPYGMTYEIAGIMDAHGPMAVSLEPDFPKGDPSPLSDVLNLPVLMSGSSITRLSTSRSTTKLLNGRSKTKLRSSRSKTKLLSSNWSLSSIVGLKLLTKNKSKTSSFGMPLLSK